MRLTRVALGLTAGFFVLAAAVAAHGHVPGEQRLLRVTSSADALEPAAHVVDRWTGYVPVVIAAAALVAGLICLRRWRAAGVTAFCIGGTVLGNALLKRAVGRGRPELLSATADVSELSFPSGHAAATAALALVVVLLVARTRWLTPAAVAATTAVLVAGAAQLVLAQHHLTDVVGGWLWAGAWTTAVWAALGTRDP